MSERKPFGKNFSAVLDFLRSRPPRETPRPEAAKILAHPLAPDARAFFEAWAQHPTPFVSLGELSVNENDPGTPVPAVGDVEMAKPSRPDVLAFGTSGGGDIFAVKAGGDGEFRAVVRIVHDRAWEEGCRKPRRYRRSSTLV